MTVMPNQLTQIFMPSKVGIKDTTAFVTEQQFKDHGLTELVSLKSILTSEEMQFVSTLASGLSMIYIESSDTKMLIPMKTLFTNKNGYTESRDTLVPKGFSARTETVNGQRGLVGFPVIAGG
jgi:hypothetical protein